MITAHDRAAYLSALRDAVAETPGLLEEVEAEARRIVDAGDSALAVGIFSARPALRALASAVRCLPSAPPFRVLFWLRPASGIFYVLRGGGLPAVEVSLEDLALMRDRLAEKEASRRADAEDVRTGRKTPADLRAENHLIAKAGRVGRWPDGRPILRAIGDRPLVRREP